MLKEKTIETSKELYSLKKSEIETNFKIKTEIDTLSEAMADYLDLRDKDGNADPKRIKKALLKEAFLITQMEKKNSLEEKYDTLEEYIDVLSNDSTIKNNLDKLINLQKTINNNKEEYKAIKKEVELTESEAVELENLNANDKEWIKFIETVVKEKAQVIKEKEEEDYNKALGKETNSTPTEVKEIYKKEEIKKEL